MFCWVIPPFMIFAYIEAQMYLGHVLDLSRSRDAIGHVAIRLTTAHFL